MTQKNISNLPEFDGHELVSYFYDSKTKLRGFIAIHNTNLGPATGGTRYWFYKNETEALRDALRLSKAMTYKCALAGVPFGGGKAVIFADKKIQKTPTFLKTYAQKVNLLGGSFSTGEDVGITDRDITTLAKHSKHINGVSSISGSPSPWAALSVYYSIKAACKEVFGTENLRNRTIAIKGIGHVGSKLCKLLLRDDATVYISDTNSAQIKKFQKTYPNVMSIAPNKIHTIKADIYAPCAMSGELTEKSVQELHSKIVCGAANNQLVSPTVGEQLHQKRILYVPDYVANSGGLINVVDNLYNKIYNKKRVLRKIQHVGKTVEKIIRISKKTNVPTFRVADTLAEKIIHSTT